MKKIIIIMISCLGILAMNFMTTNHQNKVIAENISDQNETELEQLGLVIIQEISIIRVNKIIWIKLIIS